jgi:hypothetical protein
MVASEHFRAAVARGFPQILAGLACQFWSDGRDYLGYSAGRFTPKRST